MSIDLNQLTYASHDPVKSLSAEQKEALQSAVAKIVALGAQTGVSPEEMIQLLKSGLTVGELLEFLASRSGEVA